MGKCWSWLDRNWAGRCHLKYYSLPDVGIWIKSDWKPDPKYLVNQAGKKDGFCREILETKWEKKVQYKYSSGMFYPVPHCLTILTVALSNTQNRCLFIFIFTNRIWTPPVWLTDWLTDGMSAKMRSDLVRWAELWSVMIPLISPGAAGSQRWEQEGSGDSQH